MAIRYLIPIWLCWFAFTVATSADVAAAEEAPKTGPVLKFDYSEDGFDRIAIEDFMYFIPLCANTPVVLSQSPDHTLQVRLLPLQQEDGPDHFSLTVDFEITGAGYLNYAIDQSGFIERRKDRLAAGQSLRRLLDFIRYEGPGKGRFEVSGEITEAGPLANDLRLVFDVSRGESPVRIGLRDVHMEAGEVQSANEMVAHIRSLSFSRSETRPRMDVRVASVNRKDAADNVFQNLKGRVLGRVVGLVLDPLPIGQVGHDAMISMGQALVDRAPSFTFPVADNLTVEE